MPRTHRQQSQSQPTKFTRRKINRQTPGTLLLHLPGSSHTQRKLHQRLQSHNNTSPNQFNAQLLHNTERHTLRIRPNPKTLRKLRHSTRIRRMSITTRRNRQSKKRTNQNTSPRLKRTPNHKIQYHHTLTLRTNKHQQRTKSKQFQLTTPITKITTQSQKPKQIPQLLTLQPQLSQNIHIRTRKQYSHPTN